MVGSITMMSPPEALFAGRLGKLALDGALDVPIEGQHDIGAVAGWLSRCAVPGSAPAA